MLPVIKLNAAQIQRIIMEVTSQAFYIKIKLMRLNMKSNTTKLNVLNLQTIEGEESEDKKKTCRSAD